MTDTLLIADRVLEGFDGDVPLVHEDAAILVRDGVVAQIGAQADLSAAHPKAAHHGGPGHVILPGFVNAHHHVGLTPFQLGAADYPLELWFAARLGLRAVDPRLDTLYAAFEMLASGVTTVQHLHSRAPGGIDGLHRTSAAILSAYDEIGMRVSFSMAIRDQNRLAYEDDTRFLRRLPDALQPALGAYFADYTVPLADQLALTGALEHMVDGHDRQRIQLAPSNLHWLSDAALEGVARLSDERDMGMHAHILETPYQWTYARARTGGSPLTYFAERGLLTDRLTVGHGVWMSEADIDACAGAGCAICHNCSSNFRLASGIAPVNRFLKAGLPVALGIDEAGINDDRDMLQEMRLVKHVHREPGLDSDRISADQVVRMATEHGARTTPFGARIGTLRPGAAADAVILDWRRTTWPYQDPARALSEVLVHRARPEAVHKVLVAGEVLVEEGRFTRLDRETVLHEIADALAGAPDADTAARAELATAVMPHLRKVYAGFALPWGAQYTQRNATGDQDAG